jgi:hypothetical protein
MKMNEIWIYLIAPCGLYALLGNLMVYGILNRRKVQLSSLWAGTPGYLYRVCARETEVVGPTLRRFALSTNIAFLMAMVFGFIFSGLQEK